MDNVNQPATGGSKTGMWVALITALAVLGVGAYFLFARDNGTNTNNANSVGNENVNSVVNQNLNEVANSNYNGSTEDWNSYRDDATGYSLSYPGNWTVEEIRLDADPLNAFATPIRYNIFYSPDKNYHLVIGIKKVGDSGSIYYRTSLGAGDVIDNSSAYINSTLVETKKLVYQTKAVEVFFYPIGTGTTQVLVQGFEISASFGQESTVNPETPDITSVSEYSQMLEVMQSISFNE